jgi:hypothetical protein
MNKQRYGRCHPDNIWALRGLEKCLKMRLDNVSDLSEDVRNAISTEVESIQIKINDIMKYADVDVTVACMCACKNLN